MGDVTNQGRLVNPTQIQMKRNKSQLFKVKVFMRTCFGHDTFPPNISSASDGENLYALPSKLQLSLDWRGLER